MPRYVKDDYVKGLDEFFAPIGLKVDWSKMTVKDLEALSEVLVDADKVSKLFGLAGEPVDTKVAGGGLLDGGLLEGVGGGDLRGKVGSVLDAGIDGAVEALKREKPFRSQIGSGQLIGRLLQMGGHE
jgi:hypothetical protein